MYIASVALALTCLVVASAHPALAENDIPSELALNPKDNGEIALLEGKAIMFDDYCRTVHGYVIDDLRANSDSLAGNVFEIFFNGAENLGLEAAGGLASIIRNQENPIANSDENNSVNQIIAEGQKIMQQSPNEPRSIFLGVITTLAVTSNSVTPNFMKKLDDLKSKFGTSTVTHALYNACARLANYERVMSFNFEVTRRELAISHPELANVQPSDIGCPTVGRVIRLDGVCKFAKIAQDPSIKLIKPIPFNQ